MTKRKKAHNYLPNATYKAKDRATRTPLKTGGESGLFGEVSSPCSTSGTRRVTPFFFFYER